MDLGLEGRVIIVVGGSGYVGAAIVELLTHEQAVVVSTSRRSQAGIQIDASDDQSVAEGIAQVVEQHGRIDGLVVAAAPSARTFESGQPRSADQLTHAFDGKVATFLRLADAVLPHMTERGYGRIVGVSGQNGFMTKNLVGSVRNAAFTVLGKNLADSYAGTGVTVNVVSPGLVTDEPIAAVENAGAGESRPADTAYVVGFLLSPLAGAISGESIAVGHRVRGVTTL